MSSCGNTAGIEVPNNVETIVLKINKMISDNYSMIVMYILFLVGIAFIIWYFGKSLIARIAAYNQNKSKIVSGTPTISNNSQNKEADNNNYNGDEPEPENIKDFMEPAKRKFAKDVEVVYKDYNQAINDFVATTGKADTDGVVDSSVIFKTHDNYKYEEKN